MDIESRHRFVPVAAFHTSRASLIERDPQALFLSPNHCARMDFVFRMNNQCESFRNGSVRPDVESDAGCRQISKYAGDRDVPKSNGAALQNAMAERLASVMHCIVQRGRRGRQSFGR